MSPNAAPTAITDVDARAELASAPGHDGRVAIAFTARADAAPGIWSPALGSPHPVELLPDGPGRWRREVLLPADANASWAAVADVLGEAPALAARVRALASMSARARLAADRDARFRSSDPVAPSLHRLIGAEPDTMLLANVGTVPTPDAARLDGGALCTPGPAGETSDVAGHRFTRLDERHAPGAAGTAGATGANGTPGANGATEPGDAAAPSRADEVLFLDGEVLRRCDEELAAGARRRTYLENRGAAERFRDHAHPLAFARRIAPRLADAGAAPDVVVGASAAAPSALAIGALLGAPRVVLLSPAFLSRRARERLVRIAAESGLEVDVRAGSEEVGGRAVVDAAPAPHDRRPRRRPALRALAEAFARDVAQAGGDAAFAEFSGGHDLPAWRVAIREALAGATADSSAHDR